MALLASHHGIMKNIFSFVINVYVLLGFLKQWVFLTNFSTSVDMLLIHMGTWWHLRSVASMPWPAVPTHPAPLPLSTDCSQDRVESKQSAWEDRILLFSPSVR